MSSSYVQPSSDAIADLLQMIFGAEIGVAECPAGKFLEQHVATFLDGDDNLVAVCGCDLPFVAYSGAALSMIPSDVANEMVSSNELTDSIKDNFYEVMNICSKLMMNDRSAHLRLEKIVPPGESPEVVASFVDGERTPVGFDVSIPSYGKGSLNFLIN